MRVRVKGKGEWHTMAMMMSAASGAGVTGCATVGRSVGRAGSRCPVASLAVSVGERAPGLGFGGSLRLGGARRAAFAEGTVRLAAAADGAAATEAASGAAGSKVPLSKQGNVAPGEVSPLPELEGAYAVIEAGGAQLIVQEGRYYDVNRLQAEGGDVVTFNRVLLKRSASGDYSMGAPYIQGSMVKAEVLHDLRGAKIIVQKMKPKKGYRRKQGHRADYTRLLVTKIE